MKTKSKQRLRDGAQSRADNAPVGKDHKDAAQKDAVTREAWNIFEAFLKNNGDRLTVARRIVLRQVFERHDHFRADELAADLVGGADRVSRGTVYRTLALMVQAGLVRELRDSDVHVHYEHVFGHEHHEHLICNECRRFIEFRDQDVEVRLMDICRKKGFRPTSHRVVVFGTCRECQANEKNQP